MTRTLDQRSAGEDPQTEGTNTSAWLRMTRIACLLILLWAIALNLMARELIPEVLAIGLVFGVFAVFFGGERRKLGLITAILGVVAEGVAFDRSEIVIAAGESGFWLDNRDGIRHRFTISGTDHEIDAPGLRAQRADFDLEPGEYQVFCAVPGHESMRIELIVEAQTT